MDESIGVKDGWEYVWMKGGWEHGWIKDGWEFGWKSLSVSLFCRSPDEVQHYEPRQKIFFLRKIRAKCCKSAAKWAKVGLASWKGPLSASALPPCQLLSPQTTLQNPLILYSTYKLETASKKSAKICVLLIQIRPQSDKIWMKVCGEFWTNCESDIVTFWTKQDHLINAMNIYNLANIEWSESSEESESSGRNISNIPSIDPELMLAKMDIEVFQSL